METWPDGTPMIGTKELRAKAVQHSTAAGDRDVMRVLADVLRKKIAAGEPVIPALRQILDDIMPGWHNYD